MGVDIDVATIVDGVDKQSVVHTIHNVRAGTLGILQKPVRYTSDPHADQAYKAPGRVREKESE